MSVNTSPVSAGGALAALRAGFDAQAGGAMTAAWMLHGRPGIGKTQIVQQLAAETGSRLFDLRLTTIEPQDLRGLPFYDHEAKRTVWYPPEDLPSDPDQPFNGFVDTSGNGIVTSLDALLVINAIEARNSPETEFVPDDDDDKLNDTALADYLSESGLF